MGLARCALSRADKNAGAECLKVRAGTGVLRRRRGRGASQMLGNFPLVLRSYSARIPLILRLYSARTRLVVQWCFSCCHGGFPEPTRGFASTGWSAIRKKLFSSANLVCLPPPGTLQEHSGVRLSAFIILPSAFARKPHCLRRRDDLSRGHTNSLWPQTKSKRAEC
jgi:hypothetical protein